MRQRVQKALAHAGIASRRACEDLIRAGRVKVNGNVTRIGDTTDTSIDHITVDNKPIAQEKPVTIILNKPKGVISAASDPDGHRTVRDLVKVPERIYPVGRLDRDTEGVLLLTNDGELANTLLHPRYEVAKTYQATLARPVNARDLERLPGVKIEARPVDIRNAKILSANRVELTIHEGRKHVIKKLFEAIGNDVTSLCRTAFGPLTLSGLRPGAWRKLTDDELRLLRHTSSVAQQRRVRAQQEKRPARRTGSGEKYSTSRASTPLRPRTRTRNNRT